MKTNTKYYFLESINCWVDTEELYVCTSVHSTGEPDVQNAKPISELDSEWYLHLTLDERDFISNLINKTI